MSSKIYNKKILVCGPSWIGDMVMTHSLIQILHSRYPKYQIDVLAVPWSRPIARFMPEVSTVLSLPFQHKELLLRQRRLFAQQLISMHYERAYILPNSFKSALIPWFAEIPNRIGWKAECRSVLLTDARKLDKTKIKMMYQRYAALGLNKDEEIPSFIPFPKLHKNAAESRSIANKLRLNDNFGIIGLALGAEYGSSKQWPLTYFVELATNLSNKNYRIILLGSNNDTDYCQQIVHQVEAKTSNALISNFAGKTTLDEMMQLMPLCQALVCHDSGLMHIAAALDVPLVAIYGSTSPEHTPPLSAQSKVIYKSVDCSPCFQRECPLGHHKCMRDILPNEVLTSLEELLHNSIKT